MKILRAASLTGLIILVVLFFMRDIFEPEPGSIHTFTLDDDFLKNGPELYLINGGKQLISFEEFNLQKGKIYLFDTETGKRIFHSNNMDIEGILADKYILFKDGNGIWDATNNKLCVYKDSVDRILSRNANNNNFIMLTNENGNIEKTIYYSYNNISYTHDFYFNEYHNYASILDRNETGELSDSLILNIYDAVTNKIIFSMKLPKTDGEYRFEGYNDIVRVMPPSRHYLTEDNDHIIINPDKNYIADYKARKWDKKKFKYNPADTTYLARDIFRRGISSFSVEAFQDFNYYRSKHSNSNTHSGYFGNMVFSTDKKTFAANTFESNKIGIYKAGVLDTYFDELDSHRTYSYIIFAAGFLACIILFFISYKEDAKKYVEQQEKEEKIKAEKQAKIDEENRKKQLDEDLIQAALDGKLGNVIQCVKDGAFVNTTNENGATPLFIAASKRKSGIVKHLLANNANPNKAIKLGATPLLVSMQGQKPAIKIVTALLEAKANPNMTDREGSTPLILLASENGDVETARILLEYGANVNDANKNGITALYFAAQNGFYEMAKILIENGADLDKTMNQGATPLFIASQVGNLEIVKLLLENGADKNIALNGSVTPEVIAKEKGYTEIVDLLSGSKSGSSVAPSKTKDNKTSVKKSEVELVKEYLQNLGQKCKDEGVYSIWSWLDKRDGETKYKFLYNVSESNDFEFDSPDYVTEKTMLYESGTMRSAGRELVDGPDWIEKDQQKREETQGGELDEKLLEALKANDYEESKKLLEKGADPNVIGNWQNALQIAAETGNIELVKLLVEKGADVNYTDAEGFSTIALIAHKPNDNTTDIIKYLIEKGADPYAEIVLGIPAIQIIKRYIKDFEL